MTTTGGSIGASIGGKPRITSVGFNQDSRDKEGITRNTIVGNVEIQNASGDEINRDLGKANEITKDTHRSTNINVEPQVIEYISNPTKFKEDLEVAILEGKATGETILKSIENAVNGRKSSDIGDPERRTINEIKESVIRVKTASEMNAIATGDLNSQEVLNRLNINAIEKFNPDDPDLPENVRARLDELAEDGKTIRAFYDKTTNKIFVNENLTDDAEIRASVAREWKISEDLKTGKGKANDEGQLKSTVAGELAYDDMMKRAREGKTGSISTSELDEAVMDVDSEITADKWERTKFFFRTLGNLGAGATNMVVQGGKATGNIIIAGYHYATCNKKAGDARIKRAQNNVNNVVNQPKETVKIIKKDYNETKAKIAKEKKTKKAPPKKKTQPKKQNSTEKVTVGERVQKVASGGLDVIVGLGTGGTGLGLIGASGIGEGASAGVLTPVMALTATAGGTATVVGGNKIVSGTAKIWDGLFGNAKQVRGESLNILQTGTKMVTGHPEYYNNFETLVEVGTASMAPYVPVLSNASKLSIYNAEYKKNNVFKMSRAESAIAEQGAIYLEEKNGVWEVTNNATPSIFKNKPALLPKITSTSTATIMPSSSTLVSVLPLLKNNTSTNKEVYKKTTTRKEESHSTVVKTSTKKGSTESPHSTGKTSSKSSTTGKETSRIIITDSSKGTETEIRNIGDFATITIEKHTSDIPPAYMINNMTKGGKEKTSGIGSGIYFESYRGGKTSGSKESGYRGNDEGYKFNGNSGSSGNGNSSNSSKNQDSYYEGRKIYTESELNQLGRGSNATPNRGVEYIFETPAGKPKAQEFQWGTAGSMMQQTPDGPKNIIPALRYDNRNPRGMNFIKFDGIRVENGTTYLIDVKRNIPFWFPKAMEGYKNTFDRINEAKKQNPEIKIIYEFPDKKAKTKFTDWLDKNPLYQKTIDEIRIRPEK